MAECGCDKFKHCPYSDYKCCIDSFSREEKNLLHERCLYLEPKIRLEFRVRHPKKILSKSQNDVNTFDNHIYMLGSGITFISLF